LRIANRYGYGAKRKNRTVGNLNKMQ